MRIRSRRKEISNDKPCSILGTLYSVLLGRLSKVSGSQKYGINLHTHMRNELRPDWKAARESTSWKA